MQPTQRGNRLMRGGAQEGRAVMKDIRTRIIVALASSAVLASGMSVVAVAAAGASGSAAVTIADGSTSASGTSTSPNITVYDP